MMGGGGEEKWWLRDWVGEVEEIGESSRFENLEIENLNSRTLDGFRVNSHAVVGSNLVISLDKCGGVYTFDTTRPHWGWRRILLHLVTENATPHLLNFLPSDHGSAFPIRDDLIFCPPRDHSYDLELDPHIRKSFKINMRRRDPYVCSFHNVAELRDPKCEFVNVSIHPVTGMETKLKHRIFVKSSRAIGDGIVLVSIDGYVECSFVIFQVKRALNSDKDHRYEASKISSASFKQRWMLEYMSPFVIKG